VQPTVRLSTRFENSFHPLWQLISQLNKECYPGCSIPFFSIVWVNRQPVPKTRKLVLQAVPSLLYEALDSDPDVVEAIPKEIDVHVRRARMRTITGSCCSTSAHLAVIEQESTFRRGAALVPLHLHPILERHSVLSRSVSGFPAFRTPQKQHDDRLKS